MTPTEIAEWLQSALVHLAATIPLIATLIAGLVICHRQRDRRPQVARLLKWAIVGELIWITVGSQAYWLFIRLLGQFPKFDHDRMSEWGWKIQYVLIMMPPAIVSAIIAGAALWAVLMTESRLIQDDEEQSEVRPMTTAGD